MMPLDEIISFWQRARATGMLDPVYSDSMPPASWHRRLPPTMDHRVDPNAIRGLLHVMPSGSEDRMPQIEPYDFMEFLREMSENPNRGRM